MNAQTSAPNAGDNESMGAPESSDLPVQILAAVPGDVTGACRTEWFPTVFRYPVAGGWIVGTILGNIRSASLCFSQSFVPDPDYIWTPSLAGKKLEPAPQS
jgi:hypothetical protein